MERISVGFALAHPIKRTNLPITCQIKVCNDLCFVPFNLDTKLKITTLWLVKSERSSSAENMKTGRNGGYNLHGAQGLKRVTLVQWSQRTWYSVTMAVFFQGSVENLAATRPDVLFTVWAKDSALTMEVTRSSSSASIMMMLFGFLLLPCSLSYPPDLGVHVICTCGVLRHSGSLWTGSAHHSASTTSIQNHCEFISPLQIYISVADLLIWKRYMWHGQLLVLLLVLNLYWIF